MWVQRTIRLAAQPRGFHLVTVEVLDALPGRPTLGTWQGIYLCEHRDRGGPRSIVATAWGEPAAAASQG
jgi:thiamine phosphate synthase YjbQ (UPF0047 family)